MVLHVLRFIKRHACELDVPVLVKVTTQQIVRRDEQVVVTGAGQDRLTLVLTAGKRGDMQFGREFFRFRSPVVYQRCRADDQVRAGFTRFIQPAEQQCEHLHGFAQTHFVSQDSAESFVAHRVQPTESFCLIRSEYGFEAVRHLVAVRVDDLKVFDILVKTVILVFIVGLSVKVESLECGHVNGTIVERILVDPQIAGDSVDFTGVHGCEVNEPAVTQPMEPLALMVALQQQRHFARVDFVGDRRDFNQIRTHGQPDFDGWRRHGGQSVERRSGEHGSQATQYRQPFGQQPVYRLVVILGKPGDRTVRPREVMQERFDGKPFGRSVPCDAVVPPVAVENVETLLTVSGLRIARNPIAVTVEIQLDCAWLLNGG